MSHGDDEDMTREPEMVQAYRDTWELGLHSYLSYMRDRLLLCRELLAPSGSIFVQISDENLHHVRAVLEEVFGSDCFVGVVNVAKTSGLASADSLAVACDYLLWFARDRRSLKYRSLFLARDARAEESDIYCHVELADGSRRPMTKAEREGVEPLPPRARRYRLDNLTKPGPGSKFECHFEGRVFTPGNRWWGTTPEGMARLGEAMRLQVSGNTLTFVRFFDDFSFRALNNLWEDTGTGGFLEQKLYVVQTRQAIVKRCVLMTSDPGDLVLDPTCGSGTTAFVAEQWGRRWITIDVSRVPLALARQRLLTATFAWYELKDEKRGPGGGFVYKRKQNSKGEEVGGIVPHVTLKSIANDESPEEEVLVDRPESANGITRVTGAFTVEGTIPTPVEFDLATAGGAAGKVAEATGPAETADMRTFTDRMLEVLRKSPVLRLEGNRAVSLKQIRPPAKTLSLSAEAIVANGEDKAVAFVFGPENGAVSEKLVYEAAREAHAKSYTHLYVIGFAIQPNARMLIEKSADAVGIPATYVQATPDLLMGDLLKNMRSSQIFSVCGLPDVKLRKVTDKYEGERFQVEVTGLDVFDPITMDADHRNGDDLPAWFLDTDYNGLAFHVSQAFFPRTGAWDSLKKVLRGSYEESVWDHLAGCKSAAFEGGEHGQVAVKVIDDRGNELLVVKKLSEAVK